jgi:hypothetical protein
MRGQSKENGRRAKERSNSYFTFYMWAILSRLTVRVSWTQSNHVPLSHIHNNTLTAPPPPPPSLTTSLSLWSLPLSFGAPMILNAEEAAGLFFPTWYVSYSSHCVCFFANVMLMFSRPMCPRTKVLGSCVPFMIRPKDDGSMNDESQPWP